MSAARQRTQTSPSPNSRLRNELLPSPRWGQTQAHTDTCTNIKPEGQAYHAKLALVLAPGSHHLARTSKDRQRVLHCMRLRIINSPTPFRPYPVPCPFSVILSSSHPLHHRTYTSSQCSSRHFSSVNCICCFLNLLLRHCWRVQPPASLEPSYGNPGLTGCVQHVLHQVCT